VRYLEQGQPPVIIYPTVEAAEHARSVQFASTSSDLYYHGGVSDGSSGTIGVETAPKVYVVFWGSQWNNNDPSGEANILVGNTPGSNCNGSCNNSKGFLPGVGGSPWLNTVTQYCQGVASGTYFCNGAGQAAGNQTGMVAGYWYDNASSAPSKPRQSQLASEAVRAASHFGNTTVASNATVQYVIATASGDHPSGFGSQYCAWHSSTSSSSGDIAYTNLPYITDVGATCGANFNGLGANAGITIVEGHEFAETITDQYPNGGWLDSGGSEIGDKCAWISSGQGASADVALSTGTYPVQSLWSNAFNSGSGGCVLSY
jgi:serine protease